MSWLRGLFSGWDLVCPALDLVEKRRRGKHNSESANLARLKAVGSVSSSQNGPVAWCHDYYFPDNITAAINKTLIIKNVNFGGIWLLSAFRELPKIAYSPAAHRPA